MSDVENVKESISKHMSKFIIRLGIGVLLIMYSLGRIWKDLPLFRGRSREPAIPDNAGGAYHAALEDYYAALKEDENRNPHYFLIGIGVVFLLLATYHLILALKKKARLNKQ